MNDPTVKDMSFPAVSIGFSVGLTIFFSDFSPRSTGTSLIRDFAGLLLYHWMP